VDNCPSTSAVPSNEAQLGCDTRIVRRNANFQQPDQQSLTEVLGCYADWAFAQRHSPAARSFRAGEMHAPLAALSARSAWTANSARPRSHCDAGPSQPSCQARAPSSDVTSSVWALREAAVGRTCSNPRSRPSCGLASRSVPVGSAGHAGGQWLPDQTPCRPLHESQPLTAWTLNSSEIAPGHASPSLTEVNGSFVSTVAEATKRGSSSSAHTHTTTIVAARRSSGRLLQLRVLELGLLQFSGRRRTALACDPQLIAGLPLNSQVVLKLFDLCAQIVAGRHSVIPLELESRYLRLHTNTSSIEGVRTSLTWCSAYQCCRSSSSACWAGDTSVGQFQHRLKRPHDQLEFQCMWPLAPREDSAWVAAPALADGPRPTATIAFSEGHPPAQSGPHPHAHWRERKNLADAGSLPRILLQHLEDKKSKLAAKGVGQRGGPVVDNLPAFAHNAKTGVSAIVCNTFWTARITYSASAIWLLATKGRFAVINS